MGADGKYPDSNKLTRSYSSYKASATYTEEIFAQ